MVKLLRTDTTLDLSHKAQERYEGAPNRLYKEYTSKNQKHQFSSQTGRKFNFLCYIMYLVVSIICSDALVLQQGLICNQSATPPESPRRTLDRGECRPPSDKFLHSIFPSTMHSEYTECSSLRGNEAFLGQRSVRQQGSRTTTEHLTLLHAYA